MTNAALSTAHSRESGNPESSFRLGPRLRGDERRLSRSWRRVLTCVLVGIVLASLATVVLAQEPPPPKVTIGFVDIEGDPRHEPIRAY